MSWQIGKFKSTSSTIRILLKVITWTKICDGLIVETMGRLFLGVFDCCFCEKKVKRKHLRRQRISRHHMNIRCHYLMLLIEPREILHFVIQFLFSFTFDIWDANNQRKLSLLKAQKWQKQYSQKFHIPSQLYRPLFCIFGFIKEGLVQIDQIASKESLFISSKNIAYNIMSRPVEISQFYGVQVSEYDVQPIKTKDTIQTNGNVYANNAHIYAFAYQQGTNVPSEARITRTINKNTFGQDLTVYRLDRKFRNYNSNPYPQIFKKPKKCYPKQRVLPSKTELKAMQVHSPEQIVIKAARQAYVRSVIAQQKTIIRKQAKKPSEQQTKRMQHQRKRRLERALILKAYKNELFRIFGSLIFKRGWKIGREELKERLQMPPESYGIQLMKGILRERQARARLATQIFLLKRQQYLKQKHERAKMLKVKRAQERKIYVPHSRIDYPHKQEDVYEQKRMHVQKEKASKAEGERIKRLKLRKFKKQKIWYREAYQPNRKQIKKSIDQSTIQQQESEDEDVEKYEEVDAVAQNGEKDSQMAE